MNLDIYDEDLPEVYMPWADRIKSNAGNLKLVAKFVGIPAVISIISFTVAHYANKKLKS